MEDGFPSSPAQEICLFQGSYLEAELNLVLLHPSWGHTEDPQSTLAPTVLGRGVGRNLQACSLCWLQGPGTGNTTGLMAKRLISAVSDP